MSELLRQMTDVMQTMLGHKGRVLFLAEAENGHLGKLSGAVKIVKKYKNGTLKIAPLRATADSEKERATLANEIVSLAKPELRAQVDNMVAEALKHRRADELKGMKKEIQAAIEKDGNSGVKLSGSRGCVYLSYKDKSVLL